MRSNVFDDVRRLVSARIAAECYGFMPNRAGYIRCPFHNERTASLKLFDDGGWHCFGCHAGGSSIDFVMRLFDLSQLDAIRKINEDFNLALPLDKPPSDAQKRVAQQRREMLEVQREFERWRDRFLSVLNESYRIGYTALQRITSPDQLTTREALAVRWLESLESWSDCLDSGGMAEQMQIFRERGKIGRLCGKILNCTAMRSGAA